MKLNARDIAILLRYEARQLFKSAQGVLAMLFLAMYAFWTMAKLNNNSDFINRLASDNASRNETFLLEAVKWLVDVDSDVLAKLFVDHSPFITLLFGMLAFAMPLMTIIASLDQNAADIGGKGIRFLLPRTSRDSLLVGRFLGTATFWAFVNILLGVVGTIGALILDEHHGTHIILFDGVWMTCSLFLISLPFIAFMALCSVTTGSPLVSATMGIGCYLGVILLGGLGGWIHEGLKVFRYLLPAPLRYDLVIGEPTQTIVAAVAMVVYTSVFLVAAIFIFRKRDL